MQFCEHLNLLFFTNLFLLKWSRNLIITLFALVWISLWVLLLPDIQVWLVEGRPRLAQIHRFRFLLQPLFAFPALCSLLIIIIFKSQALCAAILNRIKVRLNGSYLIEIEVFAYVWVLGSFRSLNSDKMRSDSSIGEIIPMSRSSSSSLLVPPPWFLKSREARVF